MTTTTQFKKWVLLECTTDRAWRALTDAGELGKWLGEDVRLDLRPGGVLSLRSGIPVLDGAHAVDAIEPGRLLALRWNAGGHEGRVAFRLEEHAGLCRVTIVHDVPPAAVPALGDSIGTPLGALLYAWSYALLELRSYVERGVAEGRVPPSTDPLGIDLSVTVRADAADAFRAIVDPTRIPKWNPYAGEGTKVEPRVGGRYSFGWESEVKKTDGPDEIVEYEEGHRVAVSWFLKGDRKSLVTWTVDALPGEGTVRIRLQHSGFVSDPDVVREYKLGWAHFLFSFQAYLEGGDLRPRIGDVP
jgi:uncharacterized protein YndB with AHSA1/START domain